MDEIVVQAKENMAKTVAVFRDALSTLRTGRASPAILARVEADYYGEKMPIDHIASITVPEPRQLLIKPYDRNDRKAIVAAIGAANLGLNPISEGDVIRIKVPALTEETRRIIVKKGKAMLEEAKVAIRNIRRMHIEMIRSSDEMNDDYKKRTEDDVNKVVEEKMKELDELFAIKEKDIMSL